jgi:hypothetical protein
MNHGGSPLLFRQKAKNHPWIRLEEEHRTVRRNDYGLTRTSGNIGLSVDTSKESHSYVSNNHVRPFEQEEEPAAIHSSTTGSPPRRPSPKSTDTTTATGTTTSFQQYLRQQESVRKHPWRTDVRGGRVGSKNRRSKKSWKHLVKAAVPWDEAAVCPSIPETQEEEDEQLSKGLLLRHSSQHQPKPSRDDASETSVSVGRNAPADELQQCSEHAEEEEPVRNKLSSQDSPFKSDLEEDLRRRIQTVYQGDHYIVEGMGTGKGKTIRPSTMTPQEQQTRQHLIRALRDRLQSHYTGHLAEVEVYGRKGIDQGKETVALLEEKDVIQQPAEEDGDSVISMDESVVSIQSMIVAATILQASRDLPQQFVVSPNSSSRKLSVEASFRDEENPLARNDGLTNFKSATPVVVTPSSVETRPRADSSEWDEVTVYDDDESNAPSSAAEPALPPVMPPAASSEWDEYTVQDDDESRVGQAAPLARAESDDWDEYTVETAALTTKQVDSLPKTAHPFKYIGTDVQDTKKEDDDEDDNWDEYTVETAALPPHQQVLLQSALQPRPDASKHMQSQAAESPEWDEYTVEHIADALLSLPRSLQIQQLKASCPNPTKRERLPSEVSQDSGKSSIQETVKEIVSESNERLTLAQAMGHDEEEELSYYDETIIDNEEEVDDDYWDDYTVDTVADAFVSLPRTLQLEFLRTAAPNPSVGISNDSPSVDSSLPPDDADEDEETCDDGDEWTEVSCEETIHDIPGILREANSAKSSNSRNAKPIDSDPTMSSTDSESETWHDARSNSSSNEQSSDTEDVPYPAIGTSNSQGRRRPRTPPKNLNEILKDDIFSKDVKVVENALRNLAQKADDDLEYRAHIVQSGGILSVVRAMEQNAHNARIQVLACRTLEKIAQDRENRLSVGEVGGVEAVVGAMSEHMSDEAVAEATCSALLILTSECLGNQVSTETAALDVIVSCMRRYARNTLIQETAYRTLANLCLEDKEKLIALSQMGGFVVMSAALVLHWDTPKVKNEAVSTLAQLFGRLAQYQNEY